MKDQNTIGIKEKSAATLAEKLNVLLANYQIYYQNLRGFHWNIQGRQFFTLHAKFEELYNDTLVIIDDVAERILTLDEKPLHTLEDYFANTSIKSYKNVNDGVEAAKAIVANLQTIIEVQRDVLEVASEAGDEGTVDMISDLIARQEKNTWMFNAYLK